MNEVKRWEYELGILGDGRYREYADWVFVGDVEAPSDEQH